ncbi:hypothetical protein [Streptomyces sp. BE230]|uniref:hypothetical protein n=1 Tax=Streptomyces sp. BE230 TaxID=3002526 RepID=UPI002ED04D81|nr:hypothetical protein [Streptomyces sp. BE230]
MTSVYDRLKREVATVRASVASLHEDIGTIRRQIAAAEERLRDLALTQKTLDSLPPDDAEEPVGSAAPPGEPDGQDAGEADTGSGTAQDSDEVDDSLSGVDTGSAGSKPPLEWEEGRRRMLSVLTTAGPERGMKAKAVAAAIGEVVSTPARVETTRARLKTLVKEGLVIEDSASRFAIATTDNTATADEGAPGAA